METCLCGKNKSFDYCCGKFLTRNETPKTAEELMRSRYAAFVIGDVDYIVKTHDPQSSEEIEPEELENWSKESEWLKLEVLETVEGSEKDETGIVEFKAYYKANNTTHCHHERSDFIKKDDQWYFSNGDIIQNPVINLDPKVGRNDPCPCGSGKKYKKCCKN
jgi:SEC-C motif domain protein